MALEGVSLQTKWELQLVTDVTLHITFAEPAPRVYILLPALIKEMIAENASKLVLSRIVSECTNLINNALMLN